MQLPDNVRFISDRGCNVLILITAILHRIKFFSSRQPPICTNGFPLLKFRDYILPATKRKTVLESYLDVDVAIIVVNEIMRLIVYFLGYYQQFTMLV